MSIFSFNFSIFLIVILLSYFITGKLCRQKQWYILLIGSYVFYLNSNPKFVFFLLFSTFTTWYFAKSIASENKLYKQLIADKANITKDEKKQLSKVCENKKFLKIFICLLCNIGLLVFLKYTNFIISIFDVKPLNWLVLPLGISFYTFQSIGYCVDVYRESIEPEHNFFKYALYVSFFPQICQGPIGKYSELSPQLFEDHSFDYDRFIEGLERMLLGVFKKLAIANNLGLVVDRIYNQPLDYSGLLLLLTTFIYGIQLYADFSGYMDIMLGIGQIFGIKLSENFKTPYFSKSISEFWRRWHISLGVWFKDYLYYPILRTHWLTNMSKSLLKKGNKKLAKILPTVIGLFLTWVLIGCWHGASWNFILYGVYHGSFIILATILSNQYEQIRNFFKIKDDSKIWNIFQIFRTYIIVNIGYILFRAQDLHTVNNIVFRILNNFLTGTLKESLKGLASDMTGKYFYIILCICLIILIGIELIEEKQNNIINYIHNKPTIVRWCFLYVLLFFTIAFGNNSTDSANNFLYFNF